MNHLRLDTSRPDRVTVWIDVAGRSLNVLSEPVFDELRQALAEVARSGTSLPVVLRSAKAKGFVVGADLRRILAIESDEEIQAFMGYGQAFCEELERFGRNTVALIEGACLGGGLELALACRYRALRDTPQTQLGMPEAKLGLMPGWGGTQRLIETVGLEAGMQMLLSGEPVDAQAALEIGLVDAIGEDSEEVLTRFLRSLGEGASAPIVGSATAEQWAEWQRTHSGAFSPAQQAIIQAVAAGIAQSRGAGFRAERELFFPLLASPSVRERLQRFAHPHTDF
ncbi:MAG: enoyl-CoA hydratase-related protein [Aureliella sp.]